MARSRRPYRTKVESWLAFGGLVLISAILKEPLTALALLIGVAIFLSLPAGAPYLTKIREWWAIRNAEPEEVRPKTDAELREALGLSPREKTAETEQDQAVA